MIKIDENDEHMEETDERVIQFTDQETRPAPTLRTHEEQLKLANDAEAEERTIGGVKRMNVFFNLDYFNIQDYTAIDPMHALIGFIRNRLKLLNGERGGFDNVIENERFFLRFPHMWKSKVYNINLCYF